MALTQSTTELDLQPAPAGTHGRTRLLDASAITLAGDLLALGLVLAVAGQERGWTLMLGAVSLPALACMGHYRFRLSPPTARQIGGVLGVVAVAVLGYGLAPGASVGTRTVRVAAAYAASVVALRLATRVLVTWLRTRRVLVGRALLVGAGSVGAAVGQALLDHPEYGLVPVGYLDGFEDPGLPAPLLGPVGLLDEVVADLGIRHVIIAFGATRDIDTVSLVRACDRQGLNVYMVPRLFELGVAPDGVDVDNIWGIPLQRLRRAVLQPHARIVKRAFDIAVSSVALVLAAPVLAVLAAGVKLSSPGPVFFRQRRVGQRGTSIGVLKFRSMRTNHDSDVRWSVRDDDERITPLGRFMRRTSLDELPQLFNVLRGDMSLVGPRPERPFFVDRFTQEVARYGDRHRVPVGMTGWAQVHGLRGDTPIDERARFDNQYIENWSLWRDVVILFRTIRAVILGHRGD